MKRIFLLLAIALLTTGAAAQVDLVTNTKNVLPRAKGGTGNASFTPGTCVRVSNDGSKLESAGSDCGTGSGGSAWTWRGAWSSSTAYVSGDVVSNAGSSYLAIASSTAITPGTDPTKWQLVAQKGDTGPTGATGGTGSQGPAGPDGATGPQGPAGVVAATSPVTYTAGTQTVACPTCVTSVTGTSPIVSSGGTAPAISIANAAADGTTKGAASFTAADFNATAGLISLDYVNGQKASATLSGFLSSTDWSTFNGKAASNASTTVSGQPCALGGTCTIPYSGVSGTPTLYDQTVADEGTALTQRPTVNFIGSGVSCADNVGSNRTDCTIPGGGGSTPTGTGFVHVTGGVQDSAAALVTEADQSTADNTTANVSITKHGYAPKAPNDATQQLDGTGAWSRNKWIEGRQAMVGASSSSTVPGFNDISTQVGTGSDVVADANNCTRRRETSAATTGQTGVVSGGPNYWTGRNIWFESCLGLNTLVVERSWIALASQTPANVLSSDTGSTSSIAGFRFSTNVPDTNWQACTKTSGAGSPTCTDTGIAPDANTHTFEIRFNDSTPNIVFMIDGSVVATATSNLPASGVALRYIAGVATLENVAKAFDFGYVKIRSDK